VRGRLVGHVGLLGGGGGVLVSAGHGVWAVAPVGDVDGRWGLAPCQSVGCSKSAATPPSWLVHSRGENVEG
jgi:hypothetical protein